MSHEFDALKTQAQRYSDVYRESARQAQDLSWVKRLLAHSWLGEIKLQMLRLERMIAQLEDAGTPLPEKLLKAAWGCLGDVAAALNPAAIPSPDPNAPPGADIKPVAGRLLTVLLFLLLQIAGAVVLLWFVLRLFGNTDPQTLLTREQWEERDAAYAEIGFYRRALEVADSARKRAAKLCSDTASAAADTSQACQDALDGSDAATLRASVEELVATLGGMRLGDRDLRRANRYLDRVLVALDDDDITQAKQSLTELYNQFASSPGDAPPSSIRLIVLGSLLGMLTITIHLNWKFRNRWNTVGFLPWYATRLVAAPILSLAALALLFQVTFTTDLTAATDFAALGLRGADPLTIFAVAVISGLFSNRVYDWLRQIVGAGRKTPTRPGEPAEGEAGAGAGAAGAGDATAHE